MEILKRGVIIFVVTAILVVSPVGAYLSGERAGKVYSAEVAATYGAKAVIAFLLGCLGITVRDCGIDVWNDYMEWAETETKRRNLEIAQSTGYGPQTAEENEKKWQEFLESCKDGVVDTASDLWNYWYSGVKILASDIFSGTAVPTPDTDLVLPKGVDLSIPYAIATYSSSGKRFYSFCNFLDSFERAAVYCIPGSLVQVDAYSVKHSSAHVFIDNKVYDLRYRSGFATCIGMSVTSVEVYTNLPIFPTYDSMANYLKTGVSIGAIANPWPDSPAIPWDDYIGVNNDLANENEKEGNLDNVGVLSPTGTGILDIPSDKDWVDSVESDRPITIVPDYAIPTILDVPIVLPPKPDTPDTEKPDPTPVVPDGAGDFTVDLTKLFPFCIPFDLIYAFETMSSSAVAPKFFIPFKIPSLGVNEKWEIDMADFDSAVQIFRVMETLGFIVSLIILTRNIIKG